MLIEKYLTILLMVRRIRSLIRQLRIESGHLVCVRNLVLVVLLTIQNSEIISRIKGLLRGFLMMLIYPERISLERIVSFLPLEMSMVAL